MFDTVRDKELPKLLLCSSDALDALSYSRTAKRVIVCRGACDIANVPWRISNETAGRLSIIEAYGGRLWAAPSEPHGRDLPIVAADWSLAPGNGSFRRPRF